MTYVADLERKWQLRKDAMAFAADFAQLSGDGRLLPMVRALSDQDLERIRQNGPGAMHYLSASWRGDEVLYDRLLCNGAIE